MIQSDNIREFFIQNFKIFSKNATFIKALTLLIGLSKGA